MILVQIPCVGHLFKHMWFMCVDRVCVFPYVFFAWPHSAMPFVCCVCTPASRNLLVGKSYCPNYHSLSSLNGTEDCRIRQALRRTHNRCFVSVCVFLFVCMCCVFCDCVLCAHINGQRCRSVQTHIVHTHTLTHGYRLDNCRAHTNRISIVMANGHQLQQHQARPVSVPLLNAEPSRWDRYQIRSSDIAFDFTALFVRANQCAVRSSANIVFIRVCVSV